MMEPKPHADDVLRAVAAFTGVSRKALKDDRKGFLYLSDARRLLWAALRSLGWSYPAIASYCNGRHHSSISKGLKDREVDLEELAYVMRDADARAKLRQNGRL